MDNIFIINDDQITEWSIEPNKIMPGWYIGVEVDPNKTWVDVFPIAPGALERNRFDSIKKQENGYYGMGNLIYYKSRKEAEEVLKLEKRFKRMQND
jgi:hypothetical protein